MSNDPLMQEIKPKVSFYGIKSIYYLIVVLIIVQLAALSIGKGGRWVLNEQIASAINYKYSGSFYTDPNVGYLALKTPYTPGLSFLISILPLQNTRLVNIVLLTIACLTCLFFLSCLIKISTKYLFAVEDKQFFRLIIAGIFGSCLGVYLSYSAEFKTTNIGLIISLASTLLIFLGRIKGNYLYSVAAIFLGILAILFKQQFVFIFLINLLIVQYNLIHERRFFACILILIVLGIFSFYF